MALTALEIPATQQWLAQLLETNEAGTPFSRVERLISLGVQVEYGTGGTLGLLRATVVAGTVVIAAVHAGWLPYAHIESQHVVVVVNLTPSAVTILDPAETDKSIDVPVDAWLSAWIEMDCVYALIKK
jgi:hypothetical protein